MEATAQQDGDARRSAGERTRRRLVETAQRLLARQDESSIRLRDLTAEAGTNLAAVHYHFGGLGELLSAAASEAVEQLVDAQVAELGGLPDGATIHDVAAAYFRPMITALCGPSSMGRPYVQVLARVTAYPPSGLEGWAVAATARAHDALLEQLRSVLPGVPDGALRLRAKCVGGILVVLSAVDLEPELRGRSPAEVEREVVPIVVGALTTG